jgi:hypothetical protein
MCRLNSDLARCTSGWTKPISMTVEFGNLDFMVGVAAAHMAEHLDEDPAPKFTQQKLRAMKDWSKA